MAGGTTRYRQAYNAGNTGSDLPGGVASMADGDPLIDSAHDAGRNNVPFDEWRQANLPSPSPRAPQPPRGAPGRGRPDPIRRTARSSKPSLGNPTGGRLPISFDGNGVAGLFFGFVAYSLILSVVDYGVAGPGLWFKAKFLNQPAPAPSK